MREKDVPIIDCINSITISKEGLKKTYTFEFIDNEYFSNQTLTKTIVMKDEETPLYSTGTEI